MLLVTFVLFLVVIGFITERLRRQNQEEDDLVAGNQAVYSLTKFDIEMGADTAAGRPKELKLTAYAKYALAKHVPSDEKLIQQGHRYGFQGIENLALEKAIGRFNWVYKEFSSMNSMLDPCLLRQELDIYADQARMEIQASADQLDKWWLGTMIYQANQLFLESLSSNAISDRKVVLDKLQELKGAEKKAGITKWDFSDDGIRLTLRKLAEYTGAQLPDKKLPETIKLLPPSGVVECELPEVETVSSDSGSGKYIGLGRRDSMNTIALLSNTESEAESDSDNDDLKHRRTMAPEI